MKKKAIKKLWVKQAHNIPCMGMKKINVIKVFVIDRCYQYFVISALLLAM
jgi:hypothetical protein